MMDLKIMACLDGGKIKEIANFSYSDNVLFEAVENEVFKTVIKNYAKANNLANPGGRLLYNQDRAVVCFFLLRNDWWKEIVNDFGKKEENCSELVREYYSNIYNYARQFVR